MSITPAELLACLDLTRLGDEDTPDAVDTLCRRAVTPLGAVAAVCLWPRFAARARRLLDATGGAGIPVATVANFPAADHSETMVLGEVEQSLEAGAGEIDLVLPYRQWLAGDQAAVIRLLNRVRSLATQSITLKLILETAALPTAEAIRSATRLALDQGADFIKTSTGRHAAGGATPAAVDAILEVLPADGRAGIKISGGVASYAQANGYARQVISAQGQDWLAPRRLRFGASGLLDDLIRQAGEVD